MESGTSKTRANFFGSFAICANCGGLLYPHRDANRFPDGRCKIGPCREEVPSSAAGQIVDDAADDILAYLVGPGLAEIRLYDELRRGGVDVQLYPRDDAADIGRTSELGIDVKSYACPRLLGDTLSERLGGLTTFDERCVAIPDAIVNRRPGYLEDLRYAYRGSTRVVFGKVSASKPNATRLLASLRLRGFRCASSLR